MSLQLILGNSGSGKSTYIFNKVIKDSIANPRKNYIILVPDQFTMSTQKQIVDMHPSGAIMNIDVLSFSRLAYRVFEELGVETLKVLEDSGKNLVIRKVAGDNRDKLVSLGNCMDKTGYISQVKSLISELAQYNICPEDFEKLAQSENMSPSFRAKASDIALLYSQFKDFISSEYIITEDLLSMLDDMVLDSSIVRDSVIVLDGFTGFTPLQNQLIATMLPNVEDMYVTVTIDSKELQESGAITSTMSVQDYELFAMSKKFINKLFDIASETRCDMYIHKSLGLSQDSRFVSEGRIAHLEENLFRNKTNAYTGISQDSLELIHFTDPRLEIEHVAASIAKSVREEDLRYRDIAVVCPDLDSYKGLIPRIFNRYKIPYYIDSRTNIVFNPMLEFIQGLSDMFNSNFSRASVLRFIKCGLCDLDLEEIDDLEAYIQATNIRGYKKYDQEFTKAIDKNFKERLDYYNELREIFICDLRDFREALKSKDATVQSVSVALYNLFVAYDVENQLDQMAESYEELDPIKSSEYSKIYGVVIDVIDKMVSILGQEPTNAKDYFALLMSGLDSASIGNIPRSHDCVTIGDIERTRYDHISDLYLVSANEGLIPKKSESGGIFSQIERNRLAESENIELAPSDRDKSFMQRFYLYMVLTKPSNKLIISYVDTDTSGKPMSPSYLVSTICKMFPEFQDNLPYVKRLSPELKLISQDAARDYVANMLRLYITNPNLLSHDEQDNLFLSLAYFAKLDDGLLSNIIEAAFFYHKPEEISLELFKELTGSDVIKGSVSKLEDYRMCPYRFFLDYAMKLRTNVTADIDAIDRGNIYHKGLELYAKTVDERGLSFKSLDDDTSDEIVEEVFEQVCGDNPKLGLLETARERSDYYKIKRTFKNTISGLREQLAGGSFVPKHFEVVLHDICSPEDLTYELEDGSLLKLDGKVDRIDILDNQDTMYIKIIDYKTSKHSLKPDRVYAGIDLQMYVYMDAVTRGLNNDSQVEYRPGAMYYSLVTNPVVDYEDNPVMNLGEDQLKALIVDGVTIDDLVVLQGLDNYLEEKQKSLIAPIAKKTGGEYAKSAKKKISYDEYKDTSKIVGYRVKQLASRIARADIDCKPLGWDTTLDGCNYCDYVGICKFDESIQGYCKDKPKKYKNFAEARQDLSEIFEDE